MMTMMMMLMLTMMLIGDVLLLVSFRTNYVRPGQIRLASPGKKVVQKARGAEQSNHRSSWHATRPSGSVW
jgi:hypothetical protein